MVKNLPAMLETQVQSRGQEDPLEKEMATHSCILAWRIPWTEEPGLLQSMGGKELDMTEQLTLHFTSPGVFPKGKPGPGTLQGKETEAEGDRDKSQMTLQHCLGSKKLMQDVQPKWTPCGGKMNKLHNSKMQQLCVG